MGHARSATDVIIPAFSSVRNQHPFIPVSLLPLSRARNSSLGKVGREGGREGEMVCFPTNGHNQTAIYLSQPSMAVS